MSQLILPCDLHDYLEIACLYKIKVKLIQKNNLNSVGTPVTTGVNKELGEYLIFQVKQEAEAKAIPLLSILSMQAISANPYFDKIIFSQQ